MVNDMTIAYGIIVFFVAIGIIAPYINDEFSSNYPVNTPSGIVDSIDEDDASATSAFNIIKSVFSMFFWSFGTFPVWFEFILFVPLRILLVIIIARNIWIGGGG